MGLPKMLNANLTLAQNAQLTFDTTRLRNPFNTGMWIHEFRFQLGLNTLASFRCPVVEVLMKMGRHSFMPHTVAVPLLDRMWDNFIDQQVNIGSETAEAGTSVTVFLPQYTWKLVQPLYVPEGGVVETMAWNRAADTVTARLSYICTQAEGPPPLETSIPFACQFMTPGLVGGAAKAVDVSSEAEIHNPYDEPVYLRRSVGRYFANFTRDSQYWVSGELDNNGVNIAGSLVNVWATGSSGLAIIRDPVPFEHLYPPTNKSWTVNTWMDPKSYYIFNVEQNLASLTGLSATTFRAGIAFSGYRKVRL